LIDFMFADEFVEIGGVILLSHRAFECACQGMGSEVQSDLGSIRERHAGGQQHRRSGGHDREGEMMRIDWLWVSPIRWIGKISGSCWDVKAGICNIIRMMRIDWLWVSPIRWIGKISGSCWDVKAGICNIIRWFPVIWRNRDWDHYYIYDVLEHKLKLHARRLGKDEMYEGWEQDISDIERCVDLIHKLKVGWFDDEAHRLHSERWGELHMDSGDSEGEGKIRSSVMRFWRDGVRTPEDEVEEHAQTMQMYGEIDRKNQAAREELFGILRDKIDYWWD